MQKSGANKRPRKMSEDAIAKNLERSTYTCNDAERQKKWRIKHKKCLLNDEFLDRYDDAQKNTFWKYFDKETLTTLNRALRIHGKDKTKTVWNNSDFDKIVDSFYQESIYESPYWTEFELLHSGALAWYNIHLDEVLRDSRQEILDHSLSLEKSMVRELELCNSFCSISNHWIANCSRLPKNADFAQIAVEYVLMIRDMVQYTWNSLFLCFRQDTVIQDITAGFSETLNAKISALKEPSTPLDWSNRDILSDFRYYLILIAYRRDKNLINELRAIARTRILEHSNQIKAIFVRCSDQTEVRIILNRCFPKIPDTKWDFVFQVLYHMNDTHDLFVDFNCPALWFIMYLSLYNLDTGTPVRIQVERQLLRQPRHIETEDQIKYTNLQNGFKNGWTNRSVADFAKQLIEKYGDKKLECLDERLYYIQIFFTEASKIIQTQIHSELYNIPKERADWWNEVDRMMELMDHYVELLILNTCDSEKIISNATEILIQLTAEWSRNLYSKFSVGGNLDSPIFPKSCKSCK